MCPYCFNEQIISADSKPWMIHLAKHRQDMLQNLVEASSDCLLCSFDKFTDIQTAIAHYQWGHNRSDIIKWAYLRLLPMSMPIISN